jgi:hypothetical protein
MDTDRTEVRTAGHTRRRLLLTGAAGAAGTTLAGCGLFGDDPAPKPPPAADPMAPVLDGAVTLAASYDRVIAVQPDLAARLTPIAEAHRAHAAELSRVLGVPAPAASAANPSAPPVASGTAALRSLRSAEQKAQQVAGKLCRTAPANRAALLGSISAARASHAEALR